MKRVGIWIAVIFGIAFVAIMVTSTRGLSAHRVEVCVDYQGHSDCRTASAAAASSIGIDFVTCMSYTRPLAQTNADTFTNPSTPASRAISG